MSSQIDLDGEEVRKFHLSKSPSSDRSKAKALALNDGKEREYYCRDCGKRVTESASRDHEYGHTRDCEHSVWGTDR